MKRFILIFISAAVLISSGCSGERMPVEKLMDNALKSAVSGDWKKARNYSSRAVKAAPENSNALILLALSLENTGDSEGALGAASKAAACSKKSYFAQFTKGRLLYEKNRFDSCIAPLKAALELRPKSSDALILLAQASVLLKNRKDATIYYSRLARLPEYRKNPIPWSELGIFFLSESPAKAEQYLLYALQCGPSNPALLLNVAVYYDKYMKNPGKAKIYYGRYLVLTKNQTALNSRRQDVENRLKALR